MQVLSVDGKKMAILPLYDVDRDQQNHNLCFILTIRAGRKGTEHKTLHCPLCLSSQPLSSLPCAGVTVKRVTWELVTIPGRGGEREACDT